MVQRLTRILNLLEATAAVTELVPTESISASHFLKATRWPVPSILIQSFTSPRDVQTAQQDLVFGIRCYGVRSTLAEQIYQVARTALTAYPEFGVRSPDDETAHKAVLDTYGIRWIEEEVGAQEVPEPNSGQNATPVIIGTFSANYKAT